MHVPIHRWLIWLSLWIRGLEKFSVSSTTMVIKTELWTRVHSPVVRAADCRSACPWFNSGWRHWIHIHWHVQRNNITSPITSTITMPMTTIPRKSVNRYPFGPSFLFFPPFFFLCFLFFFKKKIFPFFFIFHHFYSFFIFHFFLIFPFCFLHSPFFSIFSE